MAILGPSEIYARSRAAGFKPKDAAIFTAIVLAESGGKTDAHNPGGTGDGIVQINLKVHREVTLLQAHDPGFAFPYAFKLFTEAGNKFTPWEAYTNSTYKKYEDQAAKGLTPEQEKEIVTGVADSLANTITNNVPGADAIVGIASALQAFVKALQAGIKWITDPHNWVRIGYIVVGAGLVWSGAAQISQLPGPGRIAKAVA